MEEIFIFIENFFKKEAEVATKSTEPNIDVFNKGLDDLHAMVVNEMFNRLGLIKLNKLRDKDFYDRYKNFEPSNPRHLFKISHYKHNTYKDVWVVYTSGTNPRIRFPILSRAFFIIKEKEGFKVARSYIYSDQGGMSTTNDWEGGSGFQDLTFESLGDLIAIERYLEPKDRRDALKLYNEEA